MSLSSSQHSQLEIWVFQPIMKFISTMTMMVLGAVLLVVARAVPTPGNLNVHEQMTVEEIKQVFRTEPHAVPQYEVIPLQWPRRHERDYGRPKYIQLIAFGQNVRLWLKPLDGILAGYDTPVYHARVDKTRVDQVRFDILYNPMSTVGQFLEDKDRQSTLAVTLAANGRKLVSGYIGSQNWSIRPLPSRFNNQNLGRTQRSVDGNDYVENATFAESEEFHYHVIYKNPETPEKIKYTSLPIDTNFSNNLSSRSERSTVNVPSIIYPQILLVADYATFKRHNEDTNALLEYLIPFWNAVDMKYRGINNPSIRFNIATIIIETEPDALSYIRDSHVSSYQINIDKALLNSGIYRRSIEYTFPPDTTDIMVTMSPCDMCSPMHTHCQTLGLAHIGGACKNHDNIIPRTTLSVAIVQDKGGFDGVQTAAHELGHLFGGSHDGNVGVGCSKATGHIMGPHPVLSENVANWSSCSLQAFNIFFKQHFAVCLFNPPQTNFPMPRVLPGRVKTMDEQCMAIRGTKTCSKDPRIGPNLLAQYQDEICLRLRCLDTTGKYCVTLDSIPADGSICSDGMICLNGLCLQQADII